MEAISQQDLEQVAFIYDQIKSYCRNSDQVGSKSLSDDLETLVSETMSEISSKICEDLSSEILELHILNSRFQLFKFCSEKMSAIQDNECNTIWNQISFQFEKVFLQVYDKSIKNAEKLKNISKDLANQKKETDEVLLAAEELEKAASIISQERDLYKQELDKMKSEYQESIFQLEEENKKYLNKIIKMSKTSAENSVPAPSHLKKEIRDINPYSILKPFTKSAVTPTVRELTYKQTKDFIEEVYQAKSKFDQKCLETSQRLETLQQYIPTFLSTKYGLKSLAAEWISAIEKAIPKYSYDIDILLFGKILRNEVNEDFYIIFKQVREASLEVLRQHLKSKLPFTTEKAVKQLVEQKKTVELEEDEWMIIIKTLHEPQDHDPVTKAVVQKIWTASGTTKKKKLIFFNDLMQVLLEFQLNSHEEYLRPVINVIRNHEYNGLLNHESFKELMIDLDLESEAGRLLKKLDTNNCDSITVSSVLSLFTTECIEGETILQILYNNLNSEIE